MTKKRVPFFKRFRRNNKVDDSIIVINGDKGIELRETPALDSAKKALSNLSLLVEQNKKTYKRSQMLLSRANEIYESEYPSG